MPTRSHSEFFLTPLLILVIGPSFMSISSLVPELWQFPFISDWPEIGKSEISPSKFDPIYGDWGELEIPNLAQLSPMKCYWILQDARVTAFTVSELLRENHQEGWGGGGVKLPLPSPPRLELNWWMHIILPESGYDIGLPHRSSWYE